MKGFNIKDILINNKELLLGMIVGFIVSGTAVFGLILYSSSNVFYKNTDSHLNSTKVQAAIDEIYRKCTTTAYTLTYDTNGGEACDPSSKVVIFNGTYGTLCTPTRTGYSFDGWFTQASGGTQVTSSTIYKKGGDSTIHAHWTPITYSIGYTMNGGSNPSIKPDSDTYDNEIQISNPGSKVITIEGNANSTGAVIGPSTTVTQTFAGWSSSSSAGLGSNAMSGTSSNPTTAWDGSITTNTFFKNLRDTSGTVTMTANWNTAATTLPTLTNPAGYTCNWNTKADGTGTDYESGASFTPSETSPSSVTMYAKCSINTYTVNVNVVNGTVDQSSIVANYDTSPTFTLTPATGVDSAIDPTVSCTNDQNASISGTTLTVNNVNDDTTCTVNYTLLRYTISYAKGSDSSSTGIPSTQYKYYDQTINLDSSSPTGSSTSYTYLGWATVSGANASNATWYDPADSYSVNADLNLYAQWYNVTSLEGKYTTFIRVGNGASVNVGGTANSTLAQWDFKRSSTSKTESVTAGNGYSTELSKPTTTTDPGYSLRGVAGWSDGSGMRARQIGDGNHYTRAMSGSNTSVTHTHYFMMVRTRTATNYTSDGVDKRIDRLQKISDVSMKYNDIQMTTRTQDNVSVAKSSATTLTAQSPDSGWKFVGNAGFYISNATTDGQYSSRVYMPTLYWSDSSTTGVVANGVSNYAAKVKVQTYWTEARIKSARSTTFAPTSGKGLARYNALTALATTDSYIKYSNIHSTRTTVSGSISNWGALGLKKQITNASSHFKVIGFSGYSTSNNVDDGGASYASIAVLIPCVSSYKCYMTAYAGNAKRGDDTGKSLNIVIGGWVVFVSSDVSSLTFTNFT